MTRAWLTNLSTIQRLGSFITSSVREFSTGFGTERAGGTPSRRIETLLLDPAFAGCDVGFGKHSGDVGLV